MSAGAWTARAEIHSPFTPRELPHLEFRKDTPDEKQYSTAPLTDYDRDFRLAVLGLKDMVFRDLRDGLEGRTPRRAKRIDVPFGLKDKPGHPTWDEPFVYVEIEYPLDENVQYTPPPQLEDRAESLWWLASVLNDEAGTKDNVVSALQIMTCLAAFVRRDGEVNLVVPIAFFETYQNMDGEARDDFHRQWFSPVSHGDAYYLEGDKALPEEGEASLHVQDGDCHFAAAVAFEAHPLMLDLDAGRAFYTLKAGLPWSGNMGSPATWTERERGALWAALFRSFDRLKDFYEGTNESLPNVEEVSLDVEAPAVWGRSRWGTATWGDVKGRGVSPEEARASLSASMTVAFPKGDVFPLAFGNTIADASAVAFVQHVHQLKLPRSYDKLKTWPDLATAQIREYASEEGPGAVVDPRPSTQNAFTYPKLRQKPEAGKPKAQWQWELTPEAEKDLRRREGRRGFLDIDPRGRQAIYRCIEDSKGNLLEVWLSWNGLSSPLFRDRLAGSRKEVMKQWPKEDPEKPLLFADLDNDLKRQLSRQLERLNLYEHGRFVMEVLLGQVGRQRRNPVEIPAEVFRRLLWPRGEWAQDWKQVVERTLGGLMGLTSAWKAGNLKGEASFVGAWEYTPLGRGGHGEGIYVVSVTEPFVRSLKVFEAAGAKTLYSGVEAVVYDFNKDLPKEDRKKLNFVAFDAGRTFYHAAAALTAQQNNLAQWLEGEITKKGDPITGRRNKEKAKAGSEGAREPRLYDLTFCPLLAEGSSFVGALGHFRRNPETGRTLFGTASRAGETGGGHVDGLVALAGYPLPPGRAHARRADVVRKTLEDLKAVVVDYLGGIIVGRLTERQRADGGTGDKWFPLAEFMDLDEDTLCRKLKLLFFLPPDWNERRRATFEEVTGYRVTESVKEAEAAAWRTAAPAPVETVVKAATAEEVIQGKANGWADLGPLPNRLYAALQARELQQKDLARIFGVTKGAVSQWLRGLKLGQNPAKPTRIPEDLGRLMVRWLETGQEPTKEELEARASRRRSPARRRKV